MLKSLKGAGSTYRVNERRRRRRLLRLIFGVSIGIVIVGVILGLVYVWYMGKLHPVEIASSSTAVVSTKAAAATPVVDESAPVGVAVQTLTTPVRQGGNSAISVKTRPKAACSIRVTYSLMTDKDKESKDGGLIPKTADEYGVVSWTWTVEDGRPIGSWPVEITCAYNEKWGYGKDMLQVID